MNDIVAISARKSVPQTVADPAQHPKAAAERFEDNRYARRYSRVPTVIRVGVRGRRKGAHRTGGE